MTDPVQDVEAADAKVKTWYAKAVAWVTANPAKVVIVVAALFGLLLMKIL